MAVAGDQAGVAQYAGVMARRRGCHTGPAGGLGGGGAGRAGPEDGGAGGAEQRVQRRGSGVRGRRRPVVEGVEQHGRESGVGQGDGRVPAEVGGDQEQPPPGEVDVAVVRVRMDLQDRRPPADRGPQPGQQPLGAGVEQGVRLAGPLGVQTFLDVLLVRGDHGPVVGAQGVHELFAHVPLGEPVDPGRGADGPGERVDLTHDPLARRRQNGLQPGVQSLGSLGGCQEVREVAGAREERHQKGLHRPFEPGPAQRGTRGTEPGRVGPAAFAGLEPVETDRDLPERVRLGRHSDLGEVLGHEMKAEHPVLRAPSWSACEVSAHSHEHDSGMPGREHEFPPAVSPLTHSGVRCRTPTAVLFERSRADARHGSRHRPQKGHGMSSYEQEHDQKPSRGPPSDPQSPRRRGPHRRHGLPGPDRTECRECRAAGVRVRHRRRVRLDRRQRDGQPVCLDQLRPGLVER